MVKNLGQEVGNVAIESLYWDFEFQDGGASPRGWIQYLSRNISAEVQVERRRWF